MVSIERLKNYYKNQLPSECIKIHPPQGELKQIILIRHCKPAIKIKKKYSRKDVIEYDKEYRLAEVKTAIKPPIDISSLPVTKIYHSSLPRAAHTAKVLFGKDYDLISDERYREFERGVIGIPEIKMPLKWWKVLSRVQWFLGFNGWEIESVRKAGERSKQNAHHLAKLAFREKTVVLVAHGLHNRFVSKYLKKSGWTIVHNSGNKFLGVKILAK